MPCTNEVAILEVKSIQLIARCLRVHDVFIDHERGTFSVVGDALADLAVTRRLVLGKGHGAEEDDEDTHRIGPNFPKRSKSSSEETL